MTTEALLGIREDRGFRQYVVDSVKANIAGADKRADCLADIWIALSLLANEEPSRDALEREVWRQIMRRTPMLAHMAQGLTHEMVAREEGVWRETVTRRAKKYFVRCHKNRLSG